MNQICRIVDLKLQRNKWLRLRLINDIAAGEEGKLFQRTS